MTPAFDPAPDADDRPAATGRALVPYKPRPSVTARVFRVWLGLSIGLLIGLAFCVAFGLHDLGVAPVHIVVNGDDLSDGITISGLSDGAQAVLGLGALLLALLFLVLIPALVLLIVASVAVALVFGIGAPLIVLALALGVVTSPFWIVGLIIWLIARRRHSPSLPPSARMAA
jgi:hypothetical protein